MRRDRDEVLQRRGPPVASSTVEVTRLPAHLFAEAVSLWQGGLTRPWNVPDEDVRPAVSGRDSTVLACEREGELLSTAMVGHDGHRERVYYRAVREDEREHGAVSP